MGTKKNKSVEQADELWIPNATFGDKRPKRGSLKIEKIVKMQLDTARKDASGRIVAPGITACIQGPHGIAKTTGTSAEYLKYSVEPIAFSAAVLLPTDWYGMIPRVVKGLESGATDAEVFNDTEANDELMNVGRAMARNAQFILETHLSSRLTHDDPWALIIDEANRVQRVMLAAFMEVTVDGSVLGRVLENLAAVTLLRNPAGDGYQGIAVGDLAFESRFPTFNVTEKDFDWKAYLAQQHPGTDFTQFFSRRDSLDGTARRVFCPRVVEHTIGVTLEGLPPHVALPILPAGRQKIVNAQGEDVTETVMKMTCETLGKPYRTVEQFPGLVDTCRKLSLTKGWNLREVGPHGIGKTTSAKAFGREQEIETAVLSASMADPSTFVQLVPMDGKMQPILADRVNFDEPGLLVLDEFTLADKTVKPQMLEVTGPTRSIASLPLNVRTIWALDNPARFGAVQYSGRTADEAMVSRFVLNLEVTEEDYQWREALEDRFGEEAFKPFAEWRSQDLNPEEKDLISPRTLSIMATVHSHGLDVDEALPFLGKDRIPVRTHALKARLGNRKVLGLAAIVAEAQGLLAILNDPAADEAEKAEVSTAVVRSVQKAELKELEPHTDLLVEFVKALPPHARTSIINAASGEKGEKGQSKVLFWSEVYTKTLA